MVRMRFRGYPRVHRRKGEVRVRRVSGSRDVVGPIGVHQHVTFRDPPR